MHFRNLTHADLEAPMELPGLRDWIGGLRPSDVALLILAPAGTGKSAAVGHIAHRRSEGVMLCNLMEVLDAPNPEQQLASLLIACETQREELCYLSIDERALPNSAATPVFAIDHVRRRRGLRNRYEQSVATTTVRVR